MAPRQCLTTKHTDLTYSVCVWCMGIWGGGREKKRLTDRDRDREGRW